MFGTRKLNGVTERRKHTVINTVNSMTSQANFIKRLWAEALR